MSNLTKLVPPSELCKLIPSGEFEDSVHWYRWSYIDQKYLVVEGKPDVRLHRDPCPCGMKYFYPAPTLEEIIRKIRLDLLCGIEQHGDFYVADRHIGCFEDERAATAAIKFYFRLKGIEYNT